jgi:antitoxin PrlF
MPLIEKVATITAKGQITIPKAVRQALGADYGGKIAYRIDEHGVSLHRVEAAEDPALGAFLEFLATDIRAHPERIQLVSPELRARIEALTAGFEVDLNGPIEGAVAL